MDAEKIKIAQLDLDIDSLLNAYTKTRAEIDALKKAQKELGDQGKRNTKEFSENEIKIKSLSQSYNQQKRTISQLTDENNKLVKTETALNNAYSKEIKTIEQARKNNKELLALRNKLDLSTKEGQRAMEQLNEKLDKNNKFIKENVSAYEQQKIGIGNYQEAIEKAIPGVGGLMQTISDLKNGLIAQKTALQASTVGTTGLTKASKLLKIALISTGIGAIAVAFGLLANALSRSEGAGNKLSRAMAPLKGIFNTLLAALEPIGNFLLDGLVKGFELVQDSIDGTISLMAKAADALGFDSISESLREFQNGLAETSRQAKALADAEAELQTRQRESQRIQLEYQKRAELLRQTRDDEALSNEAREEANIKLGQLLQEQLSQELEIANLRLKVANERIKLEGETTDLLDERAEALTNVADIEERITGQISEQLTNENSLRREFAAEEDARSKARLENQTKELERTKEFEEQKLALEQEIALQKAANDQEREMIRLEQEFERHVKELEDMQLKAEEKQELEMLLLENKELAIAEIKDKFREQEVEKTVKANEIIAESEEQGAKIREGIAQKLTSSLTGLLGDSLAARLASVAVDAAIEAGLIKINAAASTGKVTANIAAANAAAIASSPLTGGLPFIATNTAKGAALIAGINATAAKSLSTVLGSAAVQGAGSLLKFEKGGLQEIGGRRHSAGGTKFWGEDGTRFEAEKGELIGVMSRTASQKFMEFNNMYSSGVSSVGKFATGGLIEPMGGQSGADMSQVIDQINNIKVVAIVDDISSAQEVQTQIISGADV